MHLCYNPPKSGWDGTRVEQANTSLRGIVSMDENRNFSRTVMVYGVYHWNQAGSFRHRKTFAITSGDHAVLGCLFQYE